MDTALRSCDRHPGEPWARCIPCRSEAKATGDAAALAAWTARVQAVECDKRFPPRFRGAAADHPEVLAWLARWNANPRECPSLLLAGAVGVGKTHQAYGVLRAAVTGPRPVSWVATTAIDMNAALRPGPRRDTEAEMLRYRTAGLLLIDDLGAAKNSEWVEETTFRVLGGRYDDELPSVFTTNLPIPAIKDALGDRIASRLAETCIRVVLAGPDRRRTGAGS